jgi:hypothetical protein
MACKRYDGAWPRILTHLDGVWPHSLFLARWQLFLHLHILKKAIDSKQARCLLFVSVAREQQHEQRRRQRGLCYENQMLIR